MSADEAKARSVPTREAQAKLVFVAIALIFFLGVAVGFMLAKGF